MDPQTIRNIKIENKPKTIGPRHSLDTSNFNETKSVTLYGCVHDTFQKMTFFENSKFPILLKIKIELWNFEEILNLGHKTKFNKKNPVSDIWGKKSAKMSYFKIIGVLIWWFMINKIKVDRHIFEGPLCTYEKMEPLRSSFMGKICATKLLDFFRWFTQLYTSCEMQNMLSGLVLCNIRSAFSNVITFWWPFWIFGQNMCTFLSHLR